MQPLTVLVPSSSPSSSLRATGPSWRRAPMTALPGYGPRMVRPPGLPHGAGGVSPVQWAGCEIRHDASQHLLKPYFLFLLTLPLKQMVMVLIHQEIWRAP